MNALARFATVLALLLVPPAVLAADLGKPVSGVKLQVHGGEAKPIEEFRGKVLVLEWFNPECPFVKKHYSSGNMQALQREYTDKGVVWLTVNSTAADHPNHVPTQKIASLTEELKMNSTGYVSDESGELGKYFGAKTTPHMFVINATGTLVYAGAIDDHPDVTSNPKVAKNYIRTALNELLAGRPLTVAQTSPYGCSVKFAS